VRQHGAHAQCFQRTAPGDILVGDAGGLVVVPPAQARAVLTAVDALLGKERTLLNNIAPGAADRRWADETLTAKGCIP
jgi:regulator of RNase E activity RraA